MKQRIMNDIAASGPMYFDTFMDKCLYDPVDGFFSMGKVRPGMDADFVTSPEVSPMFGLVVGGWAVRAQQTRSPILIEAGAGSGALLEELAPYWFDVGLDVYAVEVSQDARDAITRALPKVSVVGSFEDLPRTSDAVVVANEVLDNLPAALARRVDQRWVELAIDEADGELSLCDVPARSQVVSWCDET